MGRQKQDRAVFPTYKVDPSTVDKLKKTAIECGFEYGNTAAMGAFLDRLADVDSKLLKLILKSS
jgi:hypothetical protein